MHKTLLLIPHEFGGFPIFGWGWIFAILLAGGLLIAILRGRDPLFREELWRNLFSWLTAMAVVIFVVPRIELHDLKGSPVGVAVRGYGMFLLAAIVSAVLLTVYRGKRRGFSEDFIFSLAFWVVPGGMIGARIFYVTQYWHEYVYDMDGSIRTPLRVIGSMLSFTSGGLVVYGSMMGGLVGGAIFCYRQHASFLKLGDIIVPGLFLGVALGRLGCLMNGCCWGGACNDNWAAAHFPPGSPVYENQLSTGRLLGMELTRSPDDLPKIESVEPQSLAASTGLQVGDPVHIQIFRESPPPGTPSDDSSYLEVHVSAPGRKFQWSSDQLPRQAMPVWPAQLISSAFGFLLCCTLLIIGRWIQTPGMLFSIGFSMYAVVRFFEEVIRVDEPGRFGTSLSIAQWVSIFSLMCFMVLMLWIRYCSVSSTKLDSTAIA